MTGYTGKGKPSSYWRILVFLMAVARTLIADHMLGTLTRWMRLAGISCTYARDLGIVEDDALLRACMKEDALLLTQDEALARKARDYIRCIRVPQGKVRMQLSFVLHALDIRLPRNIEPRLCTACGSMLSRAVREEVRDAVHSRVLSSHRFFWKCTNSACQSIFWKGSHWKRIRLTLSRLRRTQS